MNKRMIAHVLGRVLMMEALLMLPSALCGLVYGERETLAFAPPMLLALAVGFLLSHKKPRQSTLYAKEGFFVVAAAWCLLSFVGALTILLCGRGLSIWDCLFETVSGFTTTGATILPKVELMPKCILFWRSFTHWVGGMGVLVFVLAIVPLADNNSLLIMRAEVPGPEVGKLAPRMRDTAKILYGVYTAMTALLVGLLLMGGMPLFDSLCNAFATAGTGGFAVKNVGVMAYNSPYIEMVLAVFMLLFGVNFNLFYFLLLGRAAEVFGNEELRWYLCIVAAAVGLIALNIRGLYGSWGDALRYSFFQVSSIITTTGAATADFAREWPQLSQHTLVLLMVVGACAGSTGGGLKVSRLAILVKTFVLEVRRAVHPRMVSVVHMEGRAVPKETCQGVLSYFAVYMLIVMASTLLLSLDGFDLATNLSAELTCFNNIGPGIGLVGPMDNFSIYSPFAKVLLSLNMLLGRLEIFPMLVLLTPGVWRKSVA